MNALPLYAIEMYEGSPWLLVDGTLTADLAEMRLIDFGSFISVEGGLVYETLPAQPWRETLLALGLEIAR
ncbi:hypothetical protein [Aeromonas finlandensis]|uniref:hypothetical protein n=1 Tax=Aeromonas finlandensis TaxID=1543375 RepID=UPI00051C7EC0|nr:hypothetical protein [Aeromonas finlandensis]